MFSSANARSYTVGPTGILMMNAGINVSRVPNSVGRSNMRRNVPHRETARLVQRLAFGLCPFSIPLPGLPRMQRLHLLDLIPRCPARFLSLTPNPDRHHRWDTTRWRRECVSQFHHFSVPTNTTANFLNNSGVLTSNILARVTGGNVSKFSAPFKPRDSGMRTSS